MSRWLSADRPAEHLRRMLARIKACNITAINADRADAHDAPPPTMHRTTPGIAATNRIFYNALWQKARLEDPDRFNTWPLVSTLLPS